MGDSGTALKHYEDGLRYIGIDASSDTIPKNMGKDHHIVASRIMSNIGRIHSDNGEHKRLCSFALSMHPLQEMNLGKIVVFALALGTG